MHDSLSSVLPVADDALDEFALVPYLWKYVGYHRTVPLCEAPVRGTGWWIGWPWRAMYRAYKLVVIDCAFHLMLKTVLAAHAVPRWGSKFADWMTKVVFLGTKLMVQPGIWLTSGQGVVDDSQPALTRKHYLFRHVEMEVFVPGRHVREATAMLQAIVEVFAGVPTSIPEPVRTQLARAGLLEQLLKYPGCYMHHYPLYFRRVLPDATAISMTSGADEPCYAIGIFCYRGQKRSFYAFARFVAVAMMRVFSARLHWGKYLPMFPQPAVTSRDFEDVYPNLPAFRDWCVANVDPEGVFQNEYTHRVFGFARPDPPRRRKTAVPSLYTVGSTPAGSSPAVRLETREGAEPT